MAGSEEADRAALGAVLGRVPSGLFILTASRGESSTGMLASWVQQAGFDPPMVTVAVRLDRYLADWIAETGKFTLNPIPADGKALLKHFGKGFAPDEPAFEGIPLREEVASGPVLAQSLGFMDAEVVGSLDGGDHRVFLAKLIAGQLFSTEAEPMVHVRKNGFHY